MGEREGEIIDGDCIAVGAAEGAFVSIFVGRRVVRGVRAGNLNGTFAGVGFAALVGLAVGSCCGNIVGFSVGFLLSCCVGFGVTSVDGREVIATESTSLVYC